MADTTAPASSPSPRLADAPDSPIARAIAGEEVDFEFLAFEAAREHLIECWAVEDLADQAAEADGTEWAEVESPASAPFDGCDTCQIRETLHAAWPVFNDKVVAQLRAAGLDDAADLVATTR